MKKISEFSKKCGGDHCLIVFDDDNGDLRPMTSPQNPVEIHSMIQKYYESQLKNGRPHKTYGIDEFLENRKNMIEVEISEWINRLATSKAKIEACDKGIQLLKNKPMGFVPNMSQENTTATTSHPNQVNYLQSISQSEVLLDDFLNQLNDKNYGMTDFSNTVDVPLNSTNELSDLEFEELIMGLSSCDWPY
ncbi:hypothetical protein ACSQ67_008588 [Phaseolus vulgaris]